MPLAEGRGAVPVVSQDPRERNAVVRDERRIARETSRELAHRAEADRVAVAACEQRRPRGRAQRRHMEAVVPQPSLGEARVVRRVDRAAERRRIAEPGIVDQDHQDVRRPLGRIHVSDRRPVRLRAVECPVGHTLERLSPDRELAAVKLAHSVRPPDRLSWNHGLRSALRADAVLMSASPSSPDLGDSRPRPCLTRPPMRSMPSGLMFLSVRRVFERFASKAQRTPGESRRDRRPGNVPLGLSEVRPRYPRSPRALVAASIVLAALPRSVAIESPVIPRSG